MIAIDHDLMMRVAKANKCIGEVMIEAMNAPDNRTRVLRLCELGRYLEGLSADVLAYAVALDGRVLGTRWRDVIDEQSIR
ncbi:hypothetical protein SAMN05216266_11853 [Amycolatopsis marina]|uniref:Uncharacterized protein n=1 Tax=Amycolatopsis marina TaxID=490629 RepID=A0A1I1BWF2_9PSEU|nr:hypothetical protein [Amycolatopsis marina]SFB54621.1 hypothetical protein SAMN05216266_11853 [Amycolatopsis marina]